MDLCSKSRQEFASKALIRWADYPLYECCFEDFRSPLQSAGYDHPILKSFALNLKQENVNAEMQVVTFLGIVNFTY